MGDFQLLFCRKITFLVVTRQHILFKYRRLGLWYMRCVVWQLELASNVTGYRTCLCQTFKISIQTLWSRCGCHLSHEPLQELQ